MPDLKERREQLIAEAKAIANNAAEEGRDLTPQEVQRIDGKIAEVKSINDDLIAAAGSADILGQLDDMARGTDIGSAGGAGHLAMTGKHANALAQKIIAEMPREVGGTKALATGVQTTSTILLPDVVPTGRPAVSVLDVLPLRIVPPSYSFLLQTARNLQASPVAAGGTKPTSPVGVGSVDNRLRVVAHISEPIDHYLLGDNVNLERFVTDELVFGLRRAVETEVLSGDGTGEHFTGILNTSGLVVQAFATNALTTVRKAITTLEASGYTPGVIVLHATDWEAIELLTATSGATDVRGVPVDPVTRRLWGVPVVLNQGLGDDVGLVIGDGAVTLDHDGRVEVKWSDAVNDDFSKNQVRCRVEGRFGISVNQPGAVVQVATAAA